MHDGPALRKSEESPGAERDGLGEEGWSRWRAGGGAEMAAGRRGMLLLKIGEALNQMRVRDNSLESVHWCRILISLYERLYIECQL